MNIILASCVMDKLIDSLKTSSSFIASPLSPAWLRPDVAGQFIDGAIPSHLPSMPREGEEVEENPNSGLVSPLSQVSLHSGGDNVSSIELLHQLLLHYQRAMVS